MEHPTQELIRETNARLRIHLSRLRDTLMGRQGFSLEDISAIAEPVGRMAQVVSETTTRSAMGLDDDLKTYAAILAELQIALEQTRFMLLARKTHLDAALGHVETMNLWAAAFKQTE